DTGHPAAAQIARLAPTLRVGAPARLERLRAFGASLGRPLTSACSCLRLDGGTDAILVVAAERAGPDLPLAERLRRLIGDGREAVAAFAPDGALLAAGEGAKPYLNGATTLEEIGAQTFA